MQREGGTSGRSCFEMQNADELQEGLFLAGMFLADSRLNLLPHDGTGIMNRHQQLCLRSNVLQIANELGAVFASGEMRIGGGILSGLEQFREMILKFSAISVVRFVEFLR